MTAPTRPLWECPRCRAKLVTRNLAHACGSYSVKKFLAGKGPKARALFQRFTEQIAACGPYGIAPAKTRVAFMVHTRFASVNRVSETGMSAHFGLPYPLRSRRINRIESLAGWYVHHFRVAEPEELDEEVQGWLRESYAQMGEQKRFAPSSR